MVFLMHVTHRYDALSIADAFKWVPIGIRQLSVRPPLTRTIVLKRNLWIRYATSVSPHQAMSKRGSAKIPRMVAS